MIPLRFRDVVLKNEVGLYNNLAHSGGCSGRLESKLDIDPAPRILWGFESLGQNACTPKRQSDGSLEQPLIGHGFIIDRPYVTGSASGSLTGMPRAVLNGIAQSAGYGDPSRKCHSFTFYLANAQFQQVNFLGQGRLVKRLERETKDEGCDAGEGPGGYFVQVAIDDDWTVYLETQQDALTWLNPIQRNIGTRVTTLGTLHHPNSDTERSEDRPTLNLDEATDLLDEFCQFLSFANGGCLGPLYIEGHREKRLEFSAFVLASRVTPLEQLGSSWLCMHSNLKGYIARFSTFRQMISAPPWNEVFGLVLEWYFQAIQPQNAQIPGKPWPIVANALGAGLERLCVTILVRELGIKGLRNLKERIEFLLKQMGLTKKRGCDDLDLVQTFVDLRNEATHPKPTATISDDSRNYVLRSAIQWIEETLLWRLGYEGKYRDYHKSHRRSTEPRYNLGTRHPEW
jgi:hypothetical protein